MRLRDRLRLSDRQQRRASWLMEVTLVGFVFIGLERGNVGVVVNSALGLAVTQVVPLLERDPERPMDPALVLWITAAVFFHALGTVGVPGTGESFYRSVPWWDHFTHALSASLVAATGFAFVRAVEEHVEGVSLTPTVTFVFILQVVVAFGVLWEVLEFGVGGLASWTGSTSVLTQYGLEDTMMDLLFDLAGGVVAAVWGTAYLANATDIIGDLIETRAE